MKTIACQTTQYALMGVAMLAVTSFASAACPEAYPYRSQYTKDIQTEPLILYWALKQRPGTGINMTRALSYGSRFAYIPVPTLTRPQPLARDDLKKLTKEDWLKIKSTEEKTSEYWLSDLKERNDERSTKELGVAQFNAKAILEVFDCWIAQSGASGKGSSHANMVKSQDSNAKPTVDNNAEHQEQEAKNLDERQESSFSGWLEQGKAEEQAEHSSGKVPRKKVYLPMEGKCLRVVDIKGVSHNKRFYWYAIQNICNYPVEALWCAGEESECRESKQAWLIQPGEKERSWMLTSRGQQGVKLYGTACLDKFKGQPVYYDKKANKCWVWNSN